MNSSKASARRPALERDSEIVWARTAELRQKLPDHFLIMTVSNDCDGTAIPRCAIPFNRRRMEDEGAAQEVRNAFTKRSHYWQQISGNKFKQLGWMKKLRFTGRRWKRR